MLDNPDILTLLSRQLHDLASDRNDVFLSVAATLVHISYLLGEYDPAYVTLTARQKQVLNLLCEGMSTNAISNHLSISPETVKDHISNILTAYQVRSRRALVQEFNRNLSSSLIEHIYTIQAP